MQKVYDFIVRDRAGRPVRLSDYRGQVILIVNTASKCGLTPQFAGLEALYQKYKDEGLIILGFPCDQFARQEFGTADEANQFCQLNYGVSFPILHKVKVNGRHTEPLYTYLKHVAPGFLGGWIKWNFTKFIISRDGSRVQRFSPQTRPEALESTIQLLLAQRGL